MRMRIILAIVAILALAAAVAAQRPGEAVRVFVVQAPSPEVLEDLGQHASIDVRWVESGLVVFEAPPGVDPPTAWGARVVAERRAPVQLAILRQDDVAEFESPRSSEFRKQASAVSVTADAGEVRLFFASEFPSDLLGCHGALVLPAHRVHPGSLLDLGPPAALAAFAAGARRPFGPVELRVVESVSVDSLARWMNLLTRDELGRPADRWVFNSLANGARPELERLYLSRLEGVMQRAVAGIPGAAIERQTFQMRRSSTVTDSTYNLIARLPGSVPGTGTFVVCAHVDATGSRNASWSADVQARRPVQTPGGEDNASGVACVAEILRCIAESVRTGDVEFAFDLEFIAFSGEEASGSEGGLVGSMRYVEARAAAGVPLLGAFNMDMVGSDSLGANLQLVHNNASRWMVDYVRDAIEALAPPVALSLVPELDESRASDHNSFWNFNAPAFLAADAPIGILRQYATYHRPSDLGDRVQVPKLAEVSRALTAALVKFNTRAHAQPLLLLDPADAHLRLEVQGAEVRYNPAAHRVWPGTPLAVQVYVRSIGASFSDSLEFEIAVERSGSRRVLTRQVGRVDLPTGARWEAHEPVSLRAEDAGTNWVEVSLAYPGPGGAPVRQSVRDTFFVEAEAPLEFVLKPNPLRGDARTAEIVVDRPVGHGDLQVDVFDLEGEWIATSTQSLLPSSGGLLRRPLLPPGTTTLRSGTNWVSGVYIVRVRWRAAGGLASESTGRLVVVR